MAGLEAGDRDRSYLPKLSRGWAEEQKVNQKNDILGKHYTALHRVGSVQQLCGKTVSVGTGPYHQQAVTVGKLLSLSRHGFLICKMGQ